MARYARGVPDSWWALDTGGGDGIAGEAVVHDPVVMGNQSAHGGLGTLVDGAASRGTDSKYATLWAAFPPGRVRAGSKRVRLQGDF